MAAQEKAIPDLPVSNTSANSSLVAVVGANTVLLPLGLATAVKTGNTPANSSATTITFPAAPWTDGSFLYVTTANNVVKRVALSTF